MAIQDVSASILEKSSKSKKVSALEIHQHNARKWKPGDVYAPHDLSAAEMKRWMYKRPGTTDAFDVLGIDPLKEYKVSFGEPFMKVVYLKSGKSLTVFNFLV